MTCIVGIVHGDQVTIGGDSAGSDECWNLTVRSDPKVFRVEDFLIGFTTSFRMGQALAFKLSPPRPKTTDLFRYMVTDFVDAVRETLKSSGFAKTENSREEGGTFLVGVSGHLFRIEGDYQVGEAACGFDAVGCGAPYALGCLAGTDGRTASFRVTQALKAAEQFSAGVRGPFRLETI